MRSRALAFCVLAGVALALSSCGGDDDSGDEPSQRPAATEGYPSSIAVLAHSGATGESSDPDQPGVEVRANSWATGTNPDVQSVYLRIQAKNPAIKGHNTNLAEGGATVDEFLLQAEDAVKLRPKPELVLIQIIDNDIACPATAGDLKEFRSKFTEGLETLAKGLPDATLFVVSQFGRPRHYASSLTAEQRIGAGGAGPCAFISFEGRIVPKELARLESIIPRYEAQLEAGCESVRPCEYDGGAFARIMDRPEHIASDLNHLSVEGHAKAAEVAWAALRRAGVVPR
jgi:hypothetical protein